MRIGSRGSSLARAQAAQVAELLGGAEVVIVRTSGDELAAGRDSDTEPCARHDSDTEPCARHDSDTEPCARRDSDAEPCARHDGHARPHPSADKSRWVDAIERALVDGEIDLAVHSAKDVPSELAPGLSLLGAPARAPVQDALCGAASLDELALGAVVGTSSLRRAAQLRAAREDLEVIAMHGNVDTRLAKLAGGALEAIVLAHAGLLRLRREQEIGALLDPQTFVPSPGQGTLALEGRAGDDEVLQAAEAITDQQTFACLLAERALARALQAGCNTPLGAWCRPDGESGLRLRAWVGMPDGSAWIADELQGSREDPQALAALLAERMRAVGAAELLAQAEAVAP